MLSLLPNTHSELNAQVSFCGLRSGQLLWWLSSKTGLLVPPSLFLLKKCVDAHIYMTSACKEIRFLLDLGNMVMIMSMETLNGSSDYWS